MVCSVLLLLLTAAALVVVGFGALRRPHSMLLTPICLT